MLIQLVGCGYWKSLIEGRWITLELVKTLLGCFEDDEETSFEIVGMGNEVCLFPFLDCFYFFFLVILLDEMIPFLDDILFLGGWVDGKDGFVGF